MLQTTNYNLSQWEAEDRILRADFNSDNAKIDTALHAQAAALAAETEARQSADAALRVRLDLRVLHTQTLAAAAASSVLRVSTANIGWSTWRRVHVFLDPVLPGGVTYSAYLNHDSRYTLANQITDPLYLLLLPMEDGRRFAHGISWGKAGAALSFPDLPFQDIASLSLSVNSANSAVLQAGTKITILGEQV